MAADSAVLDRARTAYGSGEWAAARDGFDRARREHGVDGGDLRALAECHWWLGEQEACLRELEAAFRAFTDATTRGTAHGTAHGTAAGTAHGAGGGTAVTTGDDTTRDGDTRDGTTRDSTRGTAAGTAHGTGDGTAAGTTGDDTTRDGTSHRTSHRTGDRVEAATEAALTVALVRLIRAELTVGAAWLRRVERMLDAHPSNALRARFAYLGASLAIDGSGEVWSAGAAASLRAVAEESGAPEASALAAVVEGMRLVREGDPQQGFALLDDAMLSVVSDDLDPMWGGDVLCTVIHACHELADYARMAAWTRATEEWCARRGGGVVYVGVCRVHRLELQSAIGEWADAEASLERVCTELSSDHPWVAGDGWYQLGELRRLRGDSSGAVAAYAHAREAGVDPSPGAALMELADGRPAEAWEMISASLAARDRLARVRLLRAGVQIALANGLFDAARALGRELDGAAIAYGTDGFLAWRAHAAGMLALAAGDSDDALAHLRAALARFRELRLPWEQAHVLSWMAVAHDARGEAASAEQARTDAAATCARLGARPLVVADAAPVDPGPLTAREREIVELVSHGAANREIAERLFISEKTVGRHLANVYSKLGVSSRTAAAAWWHERRRAGTGA